MPSQSALIVGCGYVGSRLQALLKQMNWEVWTARRSKNLEKQSLSIDVSAPFRVPRNFDVVFYMVSAGSYTPEAYKNAYVHGVQHTLNAIKEANFSPFFVFVSSTRVFAEREGGLVDESSPTESSSFSKESLLQGERIVSASGFRHSILRLSGIYGPGRNRVIQLVASGEARLKNAPSISNRIHVDDCVGILYHLATIENPESLYIGTDCEPTAYNDILRWLVDQLGAGPIEIEAQSSASIHMSNKRCSNVKILRSGYKFVYQNFRDGLNFSINNGERIVK